MFGFIIYIVVGCLIFKILAVAKEKKVEAIDNFFDDEEGIFFVSVLWGIVSFIVVPVASVCLIYWLISKSVDYAVSMIFEAKNKTNNRAEDDMSSISDDKQISSRTSKSVRKNLNKR